MRFGNTDMQILITDPGCLVCPYINEVQGWWVPWNFYYQIICVIATKNLGLSLVCQLYTQIINERKEKRRAANSYRQFIANYLANSYSLICIGEVSIKFHYTK